MIPGSYGQLDASMELEDLYLYFHSRFSKLPHPRSVAEIGVAANEIQFLIQWFSNLYGKPRNWCERDYVDTLPGGVLASQREMFGALLLTLAAEICRGEGGEDAVWPKVTSILRADKFSFPYLFSSANQPSELAKAALGAGARRLGCVT